MPRAEGSPVTSTPGAKVLGGEIFTHRCLKIVIDLAGIHRRALALIRYILKQLLSRQLLTMSARFCDALVIDQDLVRHATFPRKLRDGPTVGNEAHMAISQRVRPEALVAARIFDITDADSSGIQDADDDGDHFLTRQACQRQIAPNRRRRRGNASANVVMRSNFASSRTLRHST